MLNGVLQGEDTPLALGFVSHIAVLLAHAHHHALVPGPAYDGPKDCSGGVVSGKATFAHSRAIVNDKRGNVLVTHDAVLSLLPSFCRLLQVLVVCCLQSPSQALYQMFTLFGTCDTLIADRGSEFIANGTKKTLEMMGVAQDFIPSMVHHCLGACERTPRTLAERLTPYLENGLANWQDMLPSTVFSMNSSVNSSLGYSPPEIVFAERPKFPLSTPTRDIQLESIPRDLHSYVKDQARRLETIRAIFRDNTLKSQQKMLDRENAKTHPLQVKPGDYVYLNQTSTGKGQKLQPQWTGPFVVDQVPSPHTILLKNPATGRCQRHPIHINRLKMAYVRESNPSPYFLDRVVTNGVGDRLPSPDISEAISNRGASTVSDNSTVGNKPHGSSQLPRQPLRRSTRLRTRPSYYLEPIAPSAVLSSSESDRGQHHKIKRVLGRRNASEYLVQLVGEPAQQAFWVKKHTMDQKARRGVELKPLPEIR